MVAVEFFQGHILIFGNGNRKWRHHILSFNRFKYQQVLDHGGLTFLENTFFFGGIGYCGKLFPAHRGNMGRLSNKFGG